MHLENGPPLRQPVIDDLPPPKVIWRSFLVTAGCATRESPTPNGWCGPHQRGLPRISGGADFQATTFLCGGAVVGGVPPPPPPLCFGTGDLSPPLVQDTPNLCVA